MSATNTQIAVNGCCHGELDALYAVVQQVEREQNIKVDLLICCGDFEVRLSFGPEWASSLCFEEEGPTFVQRLIAHLSEHRLQVRILNAQSLRTLADLEFYCAPPKYRYLKDFHKYFSGEKRAPVLTIFIGGNHEATNVLREL